MITGVHAIMFSPEAEEGWGLLAAIRLPDGSELPIYEPRHPAPPRA